MIFRYETANIIIGTYRGPQGLDLQEDIDDAAISQKGDEPQKEKQHTEEMGDQRVGRSELRPVRVNYNSHQILRNPIGHLHAWRIGLVVIGIQVQTRN